MSKVKQFLALVLFLTAAASTSSYGKPDKVFVCHNTGSEENPIVVLLLPAKAASVHVALHGDEIVSDPADCFEVVPPQETCDLDPNTEIPDCQ